MVHICIFAKMYLSNFYVMQYTVYAVQTVAHMYSIIERSFVFPVYALEKLFLKIWA